MRCLIAALIYAAYAIVQAQAGQTDFIWGVNGHPFTAYPDIKYQQQISLLKNLGLTSYRVNISSLQDIPRLQILIAEAKAEKINILPVLTPGINLDKESPENIHDGARDFAMKFVSATKGDLPVWELGNEAENYAIIKPCEMQDDGKQYNCGWGPAGGVGVFDYYGPRWEKVSALLRGLSEGVRAADRSARRAVGTAGWGHLGAFERLKADGVDWDISVWHMYGQDPKSAFAFISKFRKPIWVTEFNHPQGSSQGELAQADGLRHWMLRLKELSTAYNVEAAFIYELLDETYWEPGDEARMGLLRLEKRGPKWGIGETKLAYHAVESVITDKFSNSIRGSLNEKTCDLENAYAIQDKIRSEIGYAYCLFLGRVPSAQEGPDLTSARVNGLSSVDMLSAIVASSEFQQRLLELSDAAFLTRVYRIYLKRDPDWVGFLNYSKQMSNGYMSRSDIVKQIIKSSEFREVHKIFF